MRATVHLAIFVISSLSLTLSAGTLLHEDFAYPNGPLVDVSAGRWATHSGTTGEIRVVSGRACLNEANTEDVHAAFTGPVSGTTVYAGFTINITSLPTFAGSYFAHLRGANDNQFKAKVFALTQGAAPGRYRLGLLAGPGGSASTNWNADLVTNIDYSVIVRFQTTDGTSTLWVNSSAGLESGVTDTNTGSIFKIVSFALREDAGIGTAYLDNLRVGTNFADVATLVPPVILEQPTSQISIEGSAVSFSVAASGSSRLAYQWQFSGTPLVGATNATLTISNVNFGHAGGYSALISNSAGSTNSALATLTVLKYDAGISVLTYNTQGNTATNWANNLQAVDRQLSYLHPDIITFQEVRLGDTHAITTLSYLTNNNFNLATNSGTDGSIRSVIASRFPIARSAKWLDGPSLIPFGYTNSPSTFTRDLFEAELVLPDFSNHVHVFTTHLNSSDDARRAAEASAISNFFVTGFLTTNGTHPYLLTGDMNDDIARPHVQSKPAIPTLISSPTGLRLTTPLNPVTGSELTFSIQSANGLAKRYDYILPGGLLFSNIISAQVFRTDVLMSPPPPLLPGDDATGSDHLPVMMVFANPYETSFRVYSIFVTNGTMALRWQSVAGRNYGVESSADLLNWTPFATNLTATSSTFIFTTNVTAQSGFFRVYRLP
jgi:endonuclease/exonuclease/phosphatase family metal-dependent hydrolase